MARMTNGTGTWICTAQFDPGWGWDDGVESAMFCYLPVWPLRVIHLHNVHGGSFTPDSYHSVPLGWSNHLVRQVFLRSWLGGCIGWGILFALLLGAHAVSPPQGKEYVIREWAVLKPILAPLAPILIVVGIVGLVVINRFTRREREIRLLLGVHHLGSSDPVDWPDEELSRMPSAMTMFGTTTYAATVPELLQVQASTGAMWAARLSAAMESETNSQVITGQVLQHPDVRRVLQSFRLGSTKWGDVMGVSALEQYQAERSIASAQQLVQLPLIEQLSIRKSTEQQDGYIAGVAAVCALLGVGLGAWLGSMVSIQLALLEAVAGSVIAAIAGAFLGNAIFGGK